MAAIRSCAGLAQGIIVEQAQEIEVMRRALAERPVAQATPQRMPAHHHH